MAKTQKAIQIPLSEQLKEPKIWKALACVHIRNNGEYSEYHPDKILFFYKGVKYKLKIEEVK